MLGKGEYSSSVESYDNTSSVASLAQEVIDGPANLRERQSPHDFQERDCVNIYLGQIGKISLLNPDEEFHLFQRISIARDDVWGTVDIDQVQKAKERVVEGNLRLVAKIAMRYRNLGLPFLDLVQEGNIGLMKAVEKFEPDKGFRFTTYATWWIQQSMMRSLTDHSRTIRLPAHIVERLGKLNRSRECLQRRNSNQPTMEEVAEETSLPIEKVRQTLELARGITSLDMPLDDGEERNCFMDLIQNESASSPEEDMLLKAMRDRLNEVLETLSTREAQILKLRFGLGGGTSHTLEQLGHIFGITRERVRQIEKKALMKLRHPNRSLRLREFTR